MCQVEQEYFGANHANVGAYLLALWGLPNLIVEAVALHHHPAQCAAPGFSPVIALHAADVFAHEFSETNTEVPPPQLDTDCLTRMGFGERIESWRETCRETIENPSRP